MDNSAYIALSRQLALFRDLDVTSNNIANSNTTGYGGEHILFSSYLDKDINEGTKNPMAFAYDVNTYRNTEDGPIQITNNDLDVAIQGSGYFTVETPLGTRYSRNGNFRIDGSGTMVTSEGYPVLDGSGQHIVFADDTTSIVIGEAGNIKVNGVDFTNLGIADFSNPQLLERLNGQLFKSPIPAQPAQNARVLQGALESANVQPVLEMTHMVSVSRAVSDTAQFIAVIYDLERKAADAWAQQS